MDRPASLPGGRQARQFVAMIVIGAATAQALGVTLKSPTQIGANDISRWCTVWSLLERGTYAIDDCPWQIETQDKVFKVDPFARGRRRGDGEPVKHFYSSKPPLLPTLIAGLLYPFRAATGVPLDHDVDQQRASRGTSQKDDPDDAGQDRVRARDAQGAGEVAGLRLLLQAGRRAAERRAAWPSSWSCTPGCSTARPERLGLVPQPLRGRAGDATCSPSTRR